MMAAVLEQIDVERAKSKKWPWYYADMGNKLSPEGRKLLEDCGVPPDEVDSHIRKVRDKAWEVFPFPCIGNFWFIEFGLCQHPRYNDVIRLLQQQEDSPTAPNPQIQVNETHPNTPAIAIATILNSGHIPKLLDLGTCLGQDLRMLHRTHSIPLPSLYGSDLFQGFESAGHDLFLDSRTFGDHFLPADVFDDSPSSPLNLTAKTWDVVTANMFLHQFDLAQQKAIAKRMIGLLRENRKGVMVLGVTAGQMVAGEAEIPPPFEDRDERGERRRIFRQSEGSMREMWEEVLVERFGDGRENWRVEVGYDGKRYEEREREGKGRKDSHYFRGDEQRKIFFCVERV